MTKKQLYFLCVPTGFIILLTLIFQSQIRTVLGLGPLAVGASGVSQEGEEGSTQALVSSRAVAPIIYAPFVALGNGIGGEETVDIPENCGPLQQEAENGTRVGLFEVVADGAASNGSFVRIPQGNPFINADTAAGNYLEYCFYITEAGLYQIGASVFAPDENSDSFYISVDGSAHDGFIWDVDRFGAFGTDYVEVRDSNSVYSANFSQGSHIVRFHAREADTRLDRVFVEAAGSQPQPVAPGPIDGSLPTQATYQLKPGNINDILPQLQAGDVVFLDPGEYTGGEITLSTSGTADRPIHILKTPGSSGKVVFNGQNSRNHLFNITGDYIHVGGTQIAAGWEPDFVIRDYTYAGLRIRQSASNLRIHHIHFLDIGGNTGGSSGYAVRFNGQNVLFEYNRIEDPSADGLQVETGEGVNIDNWVIRYNYGSNRLSSSGQWAWNAASHADFIQIQRGPAKNIEIYGNLMLGYTNALLLGDSWGSASNVTVRDNFIIYEGNGVSTQSRGDVNGIYTIENNHLLLYIEDGVDGGGRSAILLNDTGGSENVSVRCNVFYGAVDTINVSIDSSVDMSSAHNVETGNTTSFDEINSTYQDLGYSMRNARDLDGISRLSGPVGGADCTQGASFASIDEHYRMVTGQ